MTCCLLIKWNCFFMLGSIALVVLFISIRKNTLSGLWGGLAGIATPAVPFLVYFLIQGNFEAFVYEYFINVAIGTNDILDQTLFSGLRVFWKIELFTLVGVLLFCYKHKGSWGILFSLFVVIGMLLISPWYHYYLVIAPFCLFFLIAAGEFAERKFTLSKYKFSVLFILCIIGSTAFSIRYDLIRHNSVFAHDINRQSYYDISQLMATVKKPKIMFIDQELGAGVLADALPACRYWSLQTSATKSMVEERKNDLQKRKADFLVLTTHRALLNFKIHRPTETELNRLGYVYCGHCDYGWLPEVNVYCKKELYRKLPPVKLRTIDLLLKRDILSCNSEKK